MGGDPAGCVEPMPLLVIARSLVALSIDSRPPDAAPEWLAHVGVDVTGIERRDLYIFDDMVDRWQIAPQRQLLLKEIEGVIERVGGDAAVAIERADRNKPIRASRRRGGEGDLVAMEQRIVERSHGIPISSKSPLYHPRLGHCAGLRHSAACLVNARLMHGFATRRILQQMGQASLLIGNRYGVADEGRAA